tara:strand:- start:1731 stop:2876 length:1146 start_codon:yes stop_codon:yes gene_type:complete
MNPIDCFSLPTSIGFGPKPEKIPEMTDFCCAICLGPIRVAAIGGGEQRKRTHTASTHFRPLLSSSAGCAHHFCYGCYQRWIVHKPSCPTCRRPVWVVVRDIEFQAMLNKLVPEAKEEDYETLERRRVYEETLASLPPPRRIITELSDGTPLPPGIVLGNWGFVEQMGCRVISVRKNNAAARSGIRSGDIILGINGAVIGDRGHAWAVEIIERRARMGDLRLHLLRDRPPASSSESEADADADSEEDQRIQEVQPTRDAVPAPTQTGSAPSVAARVARMCRSIVPVRQRGQTRPTRRVSEGERSRAPAIELPSTRASSSTSWATASSSTGPSTSRSSAAYSSLLAEEPTTPCIFGSLILWLCCGVGEMETNGEQQAGASVRV